MRVLTLLRYYVRMCLCTHGFALGPGSLAQVQLGFIISVQEKEEAAYQDIEV